MRPLSGQRRIFEPPAPLSQRPPGRRPAPPANEGPPVRGGQGRAAGSVVEDAALVAALVAALGVIALIARVML
ncbi:MAG: hypothetical protein NUW21_13955 [Elusimicrobia bacterium]|nr:hypothetical protein [Elusimicrobiota bacterium]